MLVADRFSATVRASYRSHGSVSLLDLQLVSPTTTSMSVKLDDGGQYRCYHSDHGDTYETVEPTTSSAAWFFIVRRRYPSVWPKMGPRLA